MNIGIFTGKALSNSSLYKGWQLFGVVAFSSIVFFSCAKAKTKLSTINDIQWQREENFEYDNLLLLYHFLEHIEPFFLVRVSLSQSSI